MSAGRAESRQIREVVVEVEEDRKIAPGRWPSR
jgi:hypothetical protein